MHLALAERPGKLQQAVGQRGFAVVNVRDDAKIADVLGIHGSLCVGAVPCRVCHTKTENRNWKREERGRGASSMRRRKRIFVTIRTAELCIFVGFSVISNRTV